MWQAVLVWVAVAALRAARAARELYRYGPEAVLVKGGHLQGEGAPDVLYDGFQAHVLPGPRVAAACSHGTGCSLASALAAGLAQGLDVLTAAQRAKAYVYGALEASSDLQIGRGPQRPFNHAYQTHEWTRPKPPLDLRLYAVTAPGTSLEAVRAALKGGVTVLQVREKEKEGGPFLAFAREVVAAAQPYGVPVIINDRVDVAIASGAAGVHVGQGDLPAAVARQLLGPRRLLGVSCKTPEHVRAAVEAGADYAGCGAVFATATKDSAVIGVERLPLLRAASTLPLVAIGGIKPQHVEEVLETGVEGVAVVTAIFDAPDVEAMTRDLRRRVDAALAASRERRGLA